MRNLNGMGRESERRAGGVASVTLAVLLTSGASLVHAAPPVALTKEHPITIDATALTPPTWWQVPGVTPMIMTLDPDSSDAFRTTERKELTLKPGKYRFGTYTFDFPFTVTLQGKLEFAQSIDECVEGRGTQTLTVRCTRTVPYGGTRDY